MTGRWASSNRREELPPDWASRLVPRILNRDPDCQLQLQGCTGMSTEVDHIGDKHDHSNGNLRGVCSPCHSKRTQAQARAAHRAHYQQVRRQPEPHPGVIR